MLCSTTVVILATASSVLRSTTAIIATTATIVASALQNHQDHCSYRSYSWSKFGLLDGLGAVTWQAPGRLWALGPRAQA